jgi:S-adenosylmethionine-diacylgycerolhomoserine-N-methlytransferase
MDKVYRRQRYVYDFTRKYYLFGRDRMIRSLALRQGESLIEVGCGTARNLIHIARLYPGAELFGLDASAEMLRTAAHNVSAAGLSGRIRLVHAYAENLTPELFGRSAPFDRVLFSYSLSMIPDWRQALNAAGGALAEAGRIHVVDFGDLTGLGRFAAGLLRIWLQLFHVQPRVEILHTLETDSNRDDSNFVQIMLLPARYAFLWTAGKHGMRAFGSTHVAPQTQPGRNSLL